MRAGLRSKPATNAGVLVAWQREFSGEWVRGCWCQGDARIDDGERHRQKRVTLRLGVDPTRSGARSDVAKECIEPLKRVPRNTSAGIVFKETSLNGRVTESTNPPLNKSRLLRRLIHSPSCVSRDESRPRHLQFHSIGAVWAQPIVRMK